MSKKQITYYYRGLIQRGPYNEWREGYAPDWGDKKPSQWMTRTECRQDAIAQGAEAVFQRSNKEEV